MSLFEIATGKVGESFVRCYVWADSLPQARSLFSKKFPGEIIQQIKRVFSANDPPFVSELSDSGFGVMGTD